MRMEAECKTELPRLRAKVKELEEPRKVALRLHLRQIFQSKAVFYVTSLGKIP